MSSFQFNFSEPSSEYIYEISPTIIIHLYSSNNAVAILEFTDDNNNKINIPPGLVIYTKNYQNGKKTLEKPFIDNQVNYPVVGGRKEVYPLGAICGSYALCWTDNYMVELNNKLLFEIKNKRNWEIIAEK
jgi:hypothetical protein